MQFGKYRTGIAYAATLNVWSTHRSDADAMKLARKGLSNKAMHISDL